MGLQLAHDRARYSGGLSRDGRDLTDDETNWNFNCFWGGITSSHLSDRKKGNKGLSKEGGRKILSDTQIEKRKERMRKNHNEKVKRGGINSATGRWKIRFVGILLKRKGDCLSVKKRQRGLPSASWLGDMKRIPFFQITQAGAKLR